MRTVVAGALFVGLFLAVTAAGSDVEDVRVVNLPEVQKVEGQVSVAGPIPAARMVVFDSVDVQPGSPVDASQVVEHGILDTAGFTSVVLSLQGGVRGAVTRPGEAGALLLPDVESVIKLYEKEGLRHFSLEAEAPDIDGSTRYFTAGQVRRAVAFPAYRLYFYNTTNKTVTVQLFAYLTQ